MTAQHPYDIPTHPKLCLVEPEWVSYQGRQFLHIRGPISLTDQSLLVPENMAPLLPLCDGTRDVSALRGALALRTGVHLTESTIREFVEKMDVALLLENGAYQRAAARALEEYREAPHRAPSHAGLVYPPDAEGLSACLEDYCSQVTNEDESQAPAGALVGMVCPHIDYSRGHETYARLWRRAAPWLDDLELVVVFGTDHSGGLGALTLTRQDYLTPLGVLPTDREIVDGLAEALGPDRAFAEELHHVGEHSIELASVWLHYFLGGRSCPIVPILTGSFHHFVTGEADPDGDESIEAALAFLRQATAGRRTLVIAAGDLAHVGPAFGDASALDTVSRAMLASEDAESVAAICDGDAGAFLERSRREADSRRICGLPPIYLTLRLLGSGLRGEALGYAQCPADADGGSAVSIAGVLLYQES